MNGAGGHRDDRPDPGELRVARAEQEAQVADEGRRAEEARTGERDTTPALGEPGGPAVWRRAVEGAAVALHRRAWGDARWSYLFGADTDYATAEPPPPGTVEAAARRARAGPPPDRVQGPMMKAPVWTWEVPIYFWFGGIAVGVVVRRARLRPGRRPPLGAHRAARRARRAGALVRRCS